MKNFIKLVIKKNLGIVSIDCDLNPLEVSRGSYMHFLAKAMGTFSLFDYGGGEVLCP